MYYIELTLINQADITLNFLWSKLYTQLHLAFVEQKDTNDNIPFGLSFPEYTFNGKTKRFQIGQKLRIFADSELALQSLDVKKWLSRFSDYIHITGVRSVPDKVTGYTCYTRKQFKTSPERLARRYIKKFPEVSMGDAISRYTRVTFTETLPYVQLKSLSSEHYFRLFIEKKVMSESLEGKFSTYGLSAKTTVPEFI